jgi:hypothetical protein
MLTPTYILLLFIVSVLAAIWCLETLCRFGSTKRSGNFVAAIDICFAGAFIAAVYQLRGIAEENCSHFPTTGGGQFLATLGPFGYFGQQTGNPLAENPVKVCAMLKTSFAFGIMNVMSFVVTAAFAAMMHRNEDHEDKEARRGSHGTRRGHRRRRSGSSRRAADYHV